jgi:hypothetical protein
MLNIDITSRRHGGNQESNAAYQRNSFVADKQRLQIALILRDNPTGMTCEELAIQLGIRLTSCSGRCSELKAMGIIMANGEKRKTTSGCSASVLVINPEIAGQI